MKIILLIILTVLSLTLISTGQDYMNRDPVKEKICYYFQQLAGYQLVLQQSAESYRLYGYPSNGLGMDVGTAKRLYYSTLKEYNELLAQYRKLYKDSFYPNKEICNKILSENY